MLINRKSYFGRDIDWWDIGWFGTGLWLNLVRVPLSWGSDEYGNATGGIGFIFGVLFSNLIIYLGLLFYIVTGFLAIAAFIYFPFWALGQL